MYYITIKKKDQKRGHRQLFVDEIQARVQLKALCILESQLKNSEYVALYKENTKDYFKPILIEKIEF